jgi:hypothetical protein
MLMMHHGVNRIKEKVMGVGFCVMVSLGTVSSHAMDEDFKKPEPENTQVETTSWLEARMNDLWQKFVDSQAQKPQVDAVPAVQTALDQASQVVDEAPVAALVEQAGNKDIVPVLKDVNVTPAPQVPQVEVEPKVIRSELTIINNNVIESSQVQDNTDAIKNTLKQSQDSTTMSSGIPSGKGSDQPVVSESFWKNITFQGLAQNEKVLYGVGAVGVLTIGTVCYVLYKKGVFKKLCVSMKKHPWCTAAVTGVAALTAAAGALYLSGADKESVMNFMNGIKTQIQRLPGTIKNSLPTFGRQAKAA